MPRQRFKTIFPVSVETLFLIGGDDMSPVYLQPGSSNDQRWGLYAPYDTGAASIDRMGNEGYRFTPIHLDALLVVRGGLQEAIKERVINAGEIERDRYQLADKLNGLVLAQSVDLKG